MARVTASAAAPVVALGDEADRNSASVGFNEGAGSNTAPDTAAAGERLSLADALKRATQLIRTDHFDEADQLLAGILAHWPQQPDALHFLGVLRHGQGQTDEGIALIRQAIMLQPEAAGPWLNLGNLLIESGQADEAMVAYHESLGRDPRNALALNNLGILKRRAGRWNEAEQMFESAVTVRPDFADGWYNLSLILMQQGRIAEGVQANSKAVALWPRDLQARDAVIRALVVLGELDQAAQMYRDWLAEEPDNPVILHNLAACTRGHMPARASDAYVEQVFDSFAASFDAKLADLEYRAPDLVADALRKALAAPQRQFDVADVGCGTGLVGPLIRRWARQLAGCDLSVGMLRRAKQRGVYDVLHKAELVFYLETQPQAFDVIVSADTLCYFGDLAGVARAARTALRSEGTLVFTVEALTDDAGEAVRLQPNGRYAHGRRHLQAVLAEAGFIRVQTQADTLRLEAGFGVSGWVVTARRAA